MRTNRRRRAALCVAAVASVLLGILPARAQAPIVLSIFPTDGAIIQAFGLEIDVILNQCVNPTSTIVLEDSVGTILSGSLSFSSCTQIKFLPAETLGPGDFFVTVIATSGSGSSQTTTSFTVDNTAPAAPAGIAMTSIININTKTQVYVSGTGEPGSLVTVVIDDTNGSTAAVVCGSSGQAGCPFVDSSGHFNAGPFNVTGLDDSPAPSTALTTLSITATVTLTDGAGNVSEPAFGHAYKDTVIPAAPTVDFPAAAETNSNPRWTISGFATNEPGFRHIQIDIIDNNVAIASGKAVCAPSTNCIYSKTVILVGAGSHTIKARAVDAAGNPSALSAGNIVTLLANGGPFRPSIDSAPYPEKNAVSVSGVARPNAVVSIDVGGGGPQPCATAGPNVSPPPNYSCGSFDTSTFYGGGSGAFSLKLSDPVNINDKETGYALKDADAPSVPTVQFANGGPYVNTAQASSVLLSGSAEPASAVAVVVSSSGGGITISGNATVNAIGNWSVVVNLSSALINDGTLCADATATDSVGNVSAAATACPGPILDRSPPPPPTITSPIEGATVSTSTFPVQGLAPGGVATVQIFEGTTFLASGPAADFTGAGIDITLFGDGPHAIRARSIDLAGNVGPFSADRHLILDANAPFLASTSPVNGGSVGANGPIVAHYGDPDGPPLGTCLLEIRDQLGALVAGTVTIAGLDCTFAPAPGAMSQSGNPYTATTQATDPPGNISPKQSWQFNVDTTPPLAPVISSPPQNAALPSLTVTVEGFSETGSTVKIYEGVTLLATGSAPSGTFSISITVTEGPHTITATSTDAAGNVSPNSAGRFFITDITAPATPIITAPASGSTVPANTPVKGTAENGSFVKLYEGVTFLGQAVANPNWSITPTLPDGPHTVTATASDAAGNTSGPTSMSYTIDSSAPSQPVINAPVDGAFLNNATVTISGFADAATLVTVKEGATVIGVPVVATPSWSLVGTFSETTHTLSVTSTDGAGNISTAATVTFTVDLHPPAAPVITSPANGALLGPSVTVGGTGERLDSLDVYEGATLLGSVTVDTNGNWIMPLTFPNGSHTIKARQTDPAGNIGGFSATVTFTVDTVAPSAPVITDPSEGAITGRNVNFKGTAEPGSSITIFEGAAPILTAYASGTGAWVSAPFPFADGLHGVTARATDAVGNAGAFSALRTFTVDGTAPAVSITTQDPSLFISTPQFTGDATDAQSGVGIVEVKIYNLLNTLSQSGTATCAPGCGFGAGAITWSYIASPMLPGLYRLEVRATDTAGNVSGPASIRYISLV